VVLVKYFTFFMLAQCLIQHRIAIVTEKPRFAAESGFHRGLLRTSCALPVRSPQCGTPVPFLTPFRKSLRLCTAIRQNNADQDFFDTFGCGPAALSLCVFFMAVGVKRRDEETRRPQRKKQEAQGLKEILADLRDFDG
jgi:hypothetical protein